MIYILLLLVYIGWHLVKQPFRLWPLSLPAASLVALALCLANGMADHFFAPSGIIATPWVLVTVAALIHNARNARHALAGVVITTALCCLNDAGIKLYGGGMHDLEGQGFITLTLGVGLLAAYIFVALYLIRSAAMSNRAKLAAAVIMPLIIAGYLYFFGNLGLGRFYESHILTF